MSDKYSIPYGRQSIDEEDIESVVSVLTADYLTQGPKVDEFENSFAKYVGARFAVAVNNATAGLHLAVLALGFEKGQRVITTPITFAATANCVRYCGGEVWFADIDPGTYLICPEKVKKLIESKPKGFFSGIIPVDFGGLPVNTEALKEIAEEHDLWIIEDACHAPGGYFIDSMGEKILCGSAKYSDLCVFSFHPVKHIACGEGGMVTTNSEETYERLKLLRTHGITKRFISQDKGGWVYDMIDLGFNYRLTDIQSALGINQLKKNVKGIIRRREIAKKYKIAFKENYKYQEEPDGAFNAYHLFIIESENRRLLYDYLRSNGIYSQIHYIPIHTLSYYQNIGYESADLSNSEEYYNRCLSLPMFPTLKNEEQDYVIKQVLNFKIK